MDIRLVYCNPDKLQECVALIVSGPHSSKTQVSKLHYTIMFSLMARSGSRILVYTRSNFQFILITGQAYTHVLMNSTVINLRLDLNRHYGFGFDLHWIWYTYCTAYPI